ncbi:VOC family protein [Xenorhabdus szentirmaii]|uniref:Glyoxalase/bleomycin resistance protein/dioxygenase n=2 Tax=Xenorhabdus szentirmaii TaxID=290112 RepID=W1IUL2_9GAMM|nr:MULTISPECIES: VOC family protein [Xenorhabdus]MBD2781835.1 VOC family protein [Xenorhabdus sp. 38]MBD2793091.1 VOC family protein [Xenorhabdus sp. CUL]MBD2801460.1 VOC family protein [Xenorhabdus sp. M]MBD2806369.1 VOC family protein [Xenorhabdus sp. ZM]MBD2820003.1 VOC family protein [Xenorhabdus sp. 42]
MIGYITLGTNNFSRAAQFYDELLAELGAKRVMETPTFIAWGPDFSVANFCIIKPFDGNPATVSNGGMVALNVNSPEKVDLLYNKAIALGATDEGKPGLRGDHDFYTGYFRDLDGHKLNVFYISLK